MLRLTLMLGIAALMRTAWGYELLSTPPLEKESQQQVMVRGAEEALNRQVREKFPFAAQADPKGWFAVDLKLACTLNTFSSAGQTSPVMFLHMPLGRQVFYGVPFEIIDPKTNSDKTALALPSSRLLPNTLAPSVDVNVGRKAQMLYFLLATYYTSKEGDQSIRLNYADGTAHQLRFVGTVHSGDWFHPYTRVHTEDVRYVLVPSSADSKTHHRNMHVVQMKNPHPGKEIRSITLKGDPKAEMAIYVFAITGYAR